MMPSRTRGVLDDRDLAVVVEVERLEQDGLVLLVELIGILVEIGCRRLVEVVAVVVTVCHVSSMDVLNGITPGASMRRQYIVWRTRSG